MAQVQCNNIIFQPNLCIEEREDVDGAKDEGEEKLLAARVAGRGPLEDDPRGHDEPVSSTQRSCNEAADGWMGQLISRDHQLHINVPLQGSNIQRLVCVCVRLLSW